MLMLTLERIGIRSRRLFAFVSQQATKLGPATATAASGCMAQLQSALAIVVRATLAGSVDLRTREALVRSLLHRAADDRGRYSGGIARWVVRELEPVLPRRDRHGIAPEARHGRSESGRIARRSVEWEGATYRVDLSFAEERRLR